MPRPRVGQGYWSRRINDEHRIVYRSRRMTSPSPRPS
ncbi:MAG TPA: hypothetical protein DD490_10280 [Acidobacteria bacterium]|nr:hypothetical protein [Acidobacteriota bacterium]